MVRVKKKISQQRKISKNRYLSEVYSEDLPLESGQESLYDKLVGMEMIMSNRAEQTRERLLDAAKKLVMSKGFAGTSVDDVLKETGLTKGAFFHHFKGKADLARELVKRYALNDLKMFQEFDRQSQQISEDPLAQVIEFLKLFEVYISNSDDPAPGCMYAVYTYESRQFDPDVLDFVSDTLRKWTSIYVRKFQGVLDRYKPALPVTARELAEMIVSIIEGGLVLQRAHGDTNTTRRQSEQFRNYLSLLFPDSRNKYKRRSNNPSLKRPGKLAAPE